MAALACRPVGTGLRDGRVVRYHVGMVTAQTRLRNATRHFAATLACLSLIVLHLLGGSQFVESAIERAEFYAGTCASMDPQCSADGAGLNLGQCPAHTLNLCVHLSGVLPDLQAIGSAPAKPPRRAVVRVLTPRLVASEVYHPPRA